MSYGSMYNSIDCLANQYKMAGKLKSGTFDPYSYVPQFNPVSIPFASPTFNFGFNSSNSASDESDSEIGWSEYRSSAKKSKPKTPEEQAEAEMDDPTKWVTSEQMWAELHQKFPWLQ